MSNMREFINIMEGKIPEQKVDEGIGDWVMSKFGNKKAQGKQERAAITKQLFGQWNKWIGQTGAAGTIQDMQTFLTKVAGFKSDEVQKILSGVSSSGVGGNTSNQQQSQNQQSNSNTQQNVSQTQSSGNQAQGQQQASNESFRYRRRNRLTEAPTIPLTKKQIQDMLNSAVKFIYTDLGGPTAQNQGGQQQNDQQSNSQNSNNNQNQQTQDSNQSSSNQNNQQSNSQNSNSNQSSSNSSKSSKSSGNTQSKQSGNGKPSNAPSSFMTNLKNMGLTSEDLRDLSYTAKSGDTDVDSLDPGDQKLVTSVGWAYLKSLK